MNSHNSRIEAVFDTLLDYPADQRTRRGRELCNHDETLWREVKSLLHAAEQAQGFLSIGPEGVSWQHLSALDSELLQGERFGAYKLISEVGRGGMGVVFLAERVDGHYQSQVAIKVARHGLDSDATVDRFNAERQFLAHLSHPNIARLFDGGTSDCGHPYLVMEYIKGADIDSYCTDRELTITEVLRLMNQVCDAVHYAHQNLIVHCDLKPANIMVTAEGVPKLLDFGVATLLKPTLLDSSVVHGKAAVEEPGRQRMPLTPEFAAPEQLCGASVTTTADIYSLGVILYKLLSGRLPCHVDGMPRQETAHAVANTDVRPPSQVAQPSDQKELQGDLDNLVMKAMHKDPSQRYSSAQMLADDIAHYLADQPISATKASAFYRGRKYIKRHRWGVALGSLAALFLVLGSVTSTWQWQFAREKHRQSQYRLEKVHELTSLIVSELPGSIADLPRSTILRERLIRKGVGYLDELALANVDKPKLRRELSKAYYELARLQGNPMSANLGDPMLAHSNFEKALAIQAALLGESPNSTALRLELAASYAFLGGLEAASLANIKRAHLLTARCLALLQPIAGSEEKKVLKQLIACYTLAAHWHNVSGQYKQAMVYLRSAELQYTLLGDKHPFVLSRDGQRLRSRLHEEWAEIEAGSNNWQAALQHEKTRLTITQAHLSDTKFADRYIGNAFHALAARLVTVGEFSEAEDAYHQALAHWKNWREAYPADVSGIQALLVIHAELAELYKTIAETVPLPDASVHAREQACSSYALSLDFYASLPEAQAEFPRRYTWSLRPDEIISRHREYCPHTEN